MSYLVPVCRRAVDPLGLTWAAFAATHYSWTSLTANPCSVGQIVTVMHTVDVPAVNPPRHFLRL